MKRIWIAVGLLVLMLAGTLGHGMYLSRFTGELINSLEQAESLAESGNWETAAELTREAHEKWDARDAYLHITLRHSDTDSVYTSFHEVEEFIQCQEGGEYSAANAKLIAQLELLTEAEQLTVRNVL